MTLIRVISGPESGQPKPGRTAFARVSILTLASFGRRCPRRPDGGSRKPAKPLRRDDLPVKSLAGRYALGRFRHLLAHVSVTRLIYALRLPIRLLRIALRAERHANIDLGSCHRF